MEPWQSCCATVCCSWGQVGRRIKQTARVNLQQQTNHLCAHTWSQASFVREVSIKGFEHSHLLPAVILRCLVFAALTANGNKEASVKGVVEMSGEIPEQEEEISAPLKGSCSCEKPVQDPEVRSSWWKQWGVWRQFVPGAASGEERRRQLQHCTRTSHAPPYSFQGIWQGYSNMGLIVPVSPQSLTLSEPPVAPSMGSTVQCNALHGRTLPMDAAVKVSLLTHCSGSGQKVGYIDCQNLNSSSHPSSLGGPLQQILQGKTRATQTELSTAANTMLFSTCITHPYALTTVSCYFFKSAFSFFAS